MSQSRIPAYFRAILGCFVLAFIVSCGGGGGGGDGDDGGGGTEDVAADGGQNTVVPNTAPTAVVGPNQDAARGVAITLDGSASSDPENDTLTYTWTQTTGPDVTGGTGMLTGVAPKFNAPSDVSTLKFELKVSDGNLEDSAADSVQINVMENPDEAIFVDGDDGDDTTGDGSKLQPYQSITHALTQVNSGDDIYVKTMIGMAYVELGAATSATPDIISLTLPDGTSLYGGFDADWVRDVDNNKTGLNTRARGIRVTDVSGETWFSGFKLNAFNPGAWTTPVSSAISVDSGGGAAFLGNLYIQDNEIVAGNANGPSGTSYGLRLRGIDTVHILRNMIAAGNGGTGAAGEDGIDGNEGGDGSPGSGQSGGDGGDHFCAWGSTPTRNCQGLESIPRPGGGSISASIEGGRGGNGGSRAGGNGSSGSSGFRDGDPFNDRSGVSGGSGGNFSNQDGGNGGGGVGGGFQTSGKSRGGSGGDGRGRISGGIYVNTSAQDGTRGGHGGSGGGGGGSEGNLTTVGAGGGGGGGGGVGGKGGLAGGSGGASIAILVDDIGVLLIDDNTVTSRNGGAGGAGGDGGEGGNGGDGGDGAQSADPDDQGGDGGGGGHGGQGGQGGAGGGGPSYGILIGANMAPEIVNNRLFSGDGGAPGPNGGGSNGGARGGQYGNQGSSNGTGATGYNSGVRGSNGAQAEGGWSYPIFDTNLSDGLSPVLDNNTSTVGTAGTRGQSGEKNF